MPSRTEWSTSSLWWTLQSTSWVCSTNPMTILHKKLTAQRMSSSRCSIFGIQRWAEKVPFQPSLNLSGKRMGFKEEQGIQGLCEEQRRVWGHRLQKSRKEKDWGVVIMSWKHVELSLQFTALYLKAVTRHCHFDFVVYHGGKVILNHHHVYDFYADNSYPLKVLRLSCNCMHAAQCVEKKCLWDLCIYLKGGTKRMQL